MYCWQVQLRWDGVKYEYRYTHADKFTSCFFKQNKKITKEKEICLYGLSNGCIQNVIWWSYMYHLLKIECLTSIAPGLDVYDSFNGNVLYQIFIKIINIYFLVCTKPFRTLWDRATLTYAYFWSRTFFKQNHLENIMQHLLK